MHSTTKVCKQDLQMSRLAICLVMSQMLFVSCGLRRSSQEVTSSQALTLTCGGRGSDEDQHTIYTVHLTLTLASVCILQLFRPCNVLN